MVLKRNVHCGDVSGDRRLGKFWEGCFCRLMVDRGCTVTPHQWGKDHAACAYFKNDYNRDKRLILPDAAIWDHGMHFEVKHKNANRLAEYGLEVYRFESLLEFSKRVAGKVYYVIHDHDLSGGRDSLINKIEHWFFADICFLEGKGRASMVLSYVNGQAKKVPIYYWRKKLFRPLSEIL